MKSPKLKSIRNTPNIIRYFVEKTKRLGFSVEFFSVGVSFLLAIGQTFFPTKIQIRSDIIQLGVICCNFIVNV